MILFGPLRRHYVLVGTAVLLLIPIVMAAFAPYFAPIPSQAESWTAPPLPEREEILPGFQHLLDRLPLIVRNLPDDASRPVVAIYDTTSFNDHQSAMLMVTAAEEAIPLPDALRTTWQTWLTNPQPEDVPDDVMAYLETDSSNADRLSNLAVAMYFEVLTRGPRAFDREGSNGASKALGLLESTVVRFPESRVSILNLAYIDSLAGTLGFAGSRSGAFNTWLMANPDDATALRLAVNLYVNSNWYYAQDKDALQMLASAMSASADPVRAVFGYTMLGDLALGDLQMNRSDEFPRSELAPYATMHSARLALDYYDHALALSDDVSIYAARAFTLSLLGEIPSAISSQNRAIEMMPDSATLRLQLAELYLQQRGSTDEIRASIETARSIELNVLNSAVVEGPPRLDEFRPITNFKVLSRLASNEPERFYGYYLNLLVGGRGGGFVLNFDEIPLYEQRPTVTNSSTPLGGAIDGVALKSEALGDPDGVEEAQSLRHSFMQDENWFGVLATQVEEPSPIVAQLVADPYDAPETDLENSVVLRAASWLRFAGANQKAIDLCRSASRISGTDRDAMGRCIAENAYLLGDYETAQMQFEEIGDGFMVGYVAARRGNFELAERRFRSVISSDTSARDIAMLHLAGVYLETGDPNAAIALYDQFLASVLPSSNSSCRDKICFPLANVAPFGHSNRGIARLQALADDKGAINCDETAWEICTAAFLDFNAALETDPYNPVFLMNKAWVTRLLGDQVLSQQLMDQALAADRSLYPVLNDAGVFAALSGDRQRAEKHFMDAVAINPHYDLALWNLGVLNMQKGIGGIFHGQAYLARAILQNPLLITDSLGFRTDERVYRVEINERLQPGAGWTFGTAASVTTAAFGFVTTVFVIFQAAYLVIQNQLMETLNSRVEAKSKWVELRVLSRLPSRVKDHYGQWLSLTTALLVLAFTTTWIARHSEPNAAAASGALALFAVVLAVVTHELGHALVASRLRATIRPTQWTPGIVLALALLPVGLSSGPFPGQKVTAEREIALKWVYMAGPLANLAVAVAVYLLFVVQPLPGLRLISQVQLVAMGYALLPFGPLDGALLAHVHPKLLGISAGTALLLGVLFSVGIL